MSEMIEVVARKLASRRYSHCGGPDADTLVKGKPNWQFCIDDAALAIEAICIKEYLGALANICEHFCVPFSVSATGFPEDIVTWLAENCVLKSQIGASLSQDTHSLPSEDR